MQNKVLRHIVIDTNMENRRLHELFYHYTIIESTLTRDIAEARPASDREFGHCQLHKRTILYQKFEKSCNSHLTEYN